MIRYVYGSRDSTDLDVVHIFDEKQSLEECQIFCRSAPKEKRNIIVVEDSTVKSCFKGIPDEMNNALLVTYFLYEQDILF